MASFSLFVALVLGEASLWSPEWNARFKREEGIRRLYWSAIRSNSLHILVHGPIAFILARILMELRENHYPWWISLSGLVLCQAVGYAYGHKWMHERENYESTGHKYHHSFHEGTFLHPISAFAVSPTELWFSYIMPLAVGLIVFNAGPFVLFGTTAVVALMNLAIHTPPSALPMAKYLPARFSTNSKHFEHHNLHHVHLSAPILDVDNQLFRT